MLFEKLTRAFWFRVVFCLLLCLHPATSIEAQSQSLVFSNCTKSRNNDENGCTQCWTSEVSADAVLPQEAINAVETPCPSTVTNLQIDRGTVDAWDWGRPPGGWAINDRDGFSCTVDAKLDWSSITDSSQVAVVVQLCRIDETTPCQPVVPPIDSFSSSGTNSRIQTEMPQISVTKVVKLETKGQVDMNIEFDFGIVPSGTYRMMGSTMFSNVTSFLGISNIPEAQFLTVVHDEPLEVSSLSFTIVIIFSSAASTLILFLFCQTFSNRNAQVFELTQGKFLMAMQVCALVATCSLVLFKPVDPFCQISTPLIYLATHMFYAILLGRMWRVRAVISPLLLLTLEKKEDWTSKIVNWVNRFTACTGRQNRHQKKIRMKITDYQLARVIMLLIMPQLVMQILILVVYYDNRMVLTDIAYDGLVDGIFICEYAAFYSTLHNIAISLIGIEFLMLVILTYGSKDLPSLFNETKKVWAILRSTFVLVVFGSSLIGATIDHHNTANIRFLVPAFVLGFNMCQTCWLITWSKLKVAWSGQKILVTKLIADHNFKKSNGMGKDMTSAHDQSGFSFLRRFSVSPPTSATPPKAAESSVMPVMTPNNLGNGGNQGNGDAPDDESTDSSVLLKQNEEIVLDDLSGDNVFMESTKSLDISHLSGTSESRRRRRFSPLSYFRSAAYRTMRVSQQELASRGSMVIRRRRLPRGESTRTYAANQSSPEESEGLAHRGRFSIFGQASAPTSVVLESTIERNPRLSNTKIRITETEAPGRRLLLRMIDVQRTLAKVNMALLTGELVNKDDWEDVRGGCIALGDVFEKDVKFGWEDVMNDSSECSDISKTPPPLHQPSKNARPVASSLKSPNLSTSSGDRKSVNFSASNQPAGQDSAMRDPVLRSLLTETPLETISSPVREIDCIEQTVMTTPSDGISRMPNLESEAGGRGKEGMFDEEVPAPQTSPDRERGFAGMASIEHRSTPNLGGEAERKETSSSEMSPPMSSPVGKLGSAEMHSMKYPFMSNLGSSQSDQITGDLEELPPAKSPVSKRGSEGMVSMKQPPKRDFYLPPATDDKVVPGDSSTKEES